MGESEERIDWRAEAIRLREELERVLQRNAELVAEIRALKSKIAAARSALQ